MLIFKKIKPLQAHLRQLRKEGRRIGFIPTMGALHAGHLALIRECQKEKCVPVCSIFVNPTQFNDPTDYQQYPITISRDIDQLEMSGCAILFLPSIEEIYPRGVKRPAKTDYGHLTADLEGACRPGHFDGMIQVVRRLLAITQPDRLFMGQKDFQQQLIVGKLIKEMKLSTRLHRCATIREKDGLAMSSRNVRLVPAARRRALVLFQTLMYCKKVLSRIGVEKTLKAAQERLKKEKDIQLEYVSFRDAKTFRTTKLTEREIVVLIAAIVNGVRLIDNMLILPKKAS